jgi:hypothetical protein
MNEFHLTDPERQNFTLTVTLPLSEWQKVAGLMRTDQGVVAYPLVRVIRECVDDACQKFWKLPPSSGE